MWSIWTGLKQPLLADRGEPLRTLDGRYIIVRGRLWRAANPNLSEADRQAWVDRLMQARRAIGLAKKADDITAEKAARADVHKAKIALGERGPVWWSDGAPDQNRKLARNSTYAGWWAEVGDAEKGGA